MAARKEKKPEIKISPDEVGSLRAIAIREGGIDKNGKIKKSWANAKMNNPRTRASTKKKLNFYKNFNK